MSNWVRSSWWNARRRWSNDDIRLIWENDDDDDEDEKNVDGETAQKETERKKERNASFFFDYYSWKVLLLSLTHTRVSFFSLLFLLLLGVLFFSLSEKLVDIINDWTENARRARERERESLLLTSYLVFNWLATSDGEYRQTRKRKFLVAMRDTRLNLITSVSLEETKRINAETSTCPN